MVQRVHSRKGKKLDPRIYRSNRLFYLPGYSPELNPDEMLNQDVKSNAVGRGRAKNQGDLIVNTRSYLKNR
jgi:DDE superfamily endonuclease